MPRGSSRRSSPRPATCSRCPPGFRYEVIAELRRDRRRTTAPARSSGRPPSGPTAPWSCAAGNGYRLVQNHEASPGSTLPVPLVEGTIYDPGALGGGCTVIDVTRSGRRRSEWVGLSGTISNCAGGPTPWGSWLTCEESEAKAGTGTFEKDHGYVFEVFADQPSAQSPLADQGVGPLRPRGRRHRAEPDPRLPHRGRRRPERALLPLDRADRLPAAAADRGRPRRRRRHARGPGGARPRRQRAARPGLRDLRADRPALPDPVGQGPRPAAPPPRRSASSSPTGRSPAPRSSREPGATRTAPSSCPASRSPRPTCPPTRPSTTASSGTTGTPTRR